MSDIPSVRRRDLERRRDPRHYAVLRLAKLITGAGEQLCRIRDISAGGLMADVHCAYAEETPVIVAMGSGRAVSGKIAWVDADRIGIAFDLPIDPRLILAADPDEPTRGPRIAVDVEASLCHGGQYRIVRVHDISLGGMGVALADEGSAGKRVMINIEGLPAMSGNIGWHRDGMAGIAFQAPLDFATLATWLARETPAMETPPPDSTQDAS